MTKILKNYSILYVEDEPIIQQNICEYLESYFNKVYVASDGKKALELYYEHCPDVMLLDINLPYISGLDVAKEIRQENASVKIIMLTAYTDTEKLLAATELKLSKYLVKPIGPKLFKEAMLHLSKELLANPLDFVYVALNCIWHKNEEVLYLHNVPVNLSEKEHRLFKLLLKHKERYSFYITTDIAVSNKADTDYAVIAVWAYTRLDTWVLVDLFMSDTVDMETYTDKLLYYVKKWSVEDVTFEVSGQQLGFISTIESKMFSRNIVFRIIEVRPTGNKLQRFLNYGYRFNSGRIMLYSKDDIINDNGREIYDEIIKELTSVTKSKILSKHDDFLDAVSQLQFHTPYDKGSDIVEDIAQKHKIENSDNLSLMIYNKNMDNMDFAY